MFPLKLKRTVKNTVGIIINTKNIMGRYSPFNLAHDNNIHDATEIYYERGKHGFMLLNNVKFPRFMLKALKLHLFCLPMCWNYALEAIINVVIIISLCL